MNLQQAKLMAKSKEEKVSNPVQQQPMDPEKARKHREELIKIMKQRKK